MDLNDIEMLSENSMLFIQTLGNKNVYILLYFVSITHLHTTFTSFAILVKDLPY